MKRVRVVYRIADDVVVRPLGDELIVLHPETERLLSLTGPGPRIWQLLSEGHDVEEISARLQREYEGSDSVVRRDLDAFLACLLEEHLIRTDRPSTTAGQRE